jgi:biopolymer transport protein ExbD
MMKKKKSNRWNGLKLLLFIPLITVLLMSFSKTLEITTEKEILRDIITSPQQIEQNQNEQTSLVIGIRKDGNYVDNKLCSLEEVVKNAKLWQKTGREEILLLVDDPLLYDRIDEVRLALDNSHIYHVNQSTPGSDEIIYPHGDVSKLAEFTEGNWSNWFYDQINRSNVVKNKDESFNITIGFIIDKNGKVSDARILKGTDSPEINMAVKEILTRVPDWKPAIKGSTTVNVFYRSIFSYNIKTTVTTVVKSN